MNIYNVNQDDDEDEFTTAIINNSIIKSIDIIDPKFGVQVQIVGDKIWVNVDGICLLRASGCPLIEVDNDASNR